MMKSRETFCPRVKTRQNSSFASNWEMYDTFVQLNEEAESSSIETSSESLALGVNDYNQDDADSEDSYRISQDEKQYAKLLKNSKFMEAVCVIERLLANNCFNEQQKIFRGLTTQDDFRENIEYNYKLKYLWTFANENTKGMKNLEYECFVSFS